MLMILQHSHWLCLCYRSSEGKWKTWHSCFSQLHQRFTSSLLSWCSIFTGRDHATNQFPLVGSLTSSLAIWCSNSGSCKLSQYYGVNNLGIFLTQHPNNVLNVNKHTHVIKKILSINWWEFTLLHILFYMTWGFVYMFQKSLFHPKIHNFCSIEKLFIGYIEWASRCLYIKFLSNFKIFE